MPKTKELKRQEAIERMQNSLNNWEITKTTLSDTPIQLRIPEFPELMEKVNSKISTLMRVIRNTKAKMKGYYEF